MYFGVELGTVFISIRHKNSNMNKVLIIRKGSYKDYLSNGIGGGFIIGLLFFLISLTHKPVLESLKIGLEYWFGIIFLFSGPGFFLEEYFKRKIKIKKLLSERYMFLHENNFTIHPDLYFEGIYKDFSIRVWPTTKWQDRKKNLEYDIIEAFYSFNPDFNDIENEKTMSRDFYIGHLYFKNHQVKFIPLDWENPDFKTNLNGLVDILKNEMLNPLSRIEWVEKFGNKLFEIADVKEKARTKQIIKIGKIDVKYIKPEKKENKS